MKKVLLVDDNVMMRRLIINLFKHQNIEFHEASDGQEGLEKIAVETYDLVITDIIMPGMEGIEMIMMAKKQNPELKIVAMSGSKPYYLYMAKKLGVQAVFTKPLNHEHFFHSINSMLNFQPECISKAS